MFARKTRIRKSRSSRELQIALIVCLTALAQMACFLGHIHPAPPLDLRGTCPQELAVGETIIFYLYSKDKPWRYEWASDIQPNSSGTVQVTQIGRHHEWYYDDIIPINNWKLSFTALEPGPVTLDWGTEPCHILIVEPDEPEGQTVQDQEPETPSLADDGALEVDLPQVEPASVSISADGALVEPAASLAVVGDQPIQLEADPVNLSEPVSFAWEPADGLNDPSIANPLATLEETITYTVTATDSEGNRAAQSISLNINPADEEVDVILRSFICEPDRLTVRFDGFEPDESSTSSYAARVGGYPFACLTWEGLPNSVLCSGSLSTQGTEAMVHLVGEDQGQILYSATHAVPMCSTASGGSGSGSGGDGPDPEPTPYECPPIECG